LAKYSPDDAEESSFGNLVKGGENGEDFERVSMPAAFAEPFDVVLRAETRPMSSRRGDAGGNRGCGIRGYIFLRSSRSFRASGERLVERLCGLAEFRG